VLAVGSSRRGPGRYRRPSASAGRAVLSSTERDRSGRCPAASWSTSRAASAALTVGAVSIDRSPTSTVEVPPWRCGAPGGRTHPVTGSPAVPGPGSVTGPGPAEPKSPPCRHRQPRPTPHPHMAAPGRARRGHHMRQPDTLEPPAQRRGIPFGSPLTASKSNTISRNNPALSARYTAHGAPGESAVVRAVRV